MHLQLGRVAVLTAEDVRIANPPGFSADAPFAQAERLVMRIDLLDSWRAGALVLPEVVIVKPVVQAAARDDRRNNYTLASAAPGPGQPTLLRIGILRIEAAPHTHPFTDVPETGDEAVAAAADPDPGSDRVLLELMEDFARIADADRRRALLVMARALATGR
jgi:hypothetical protein